MKKTKHKIAIAVESTSGGSRKHVVDLVANLDRSKYDITLIYSLDRADEIFRNDLKTLEKNPSVSLIEIPMSRSINPLSDFLCLIKFIKLFKEINPDVIHLHSAKAGAIGRVAAKILGIKKVAFNPHGGSFHRFEGKLGFIYLFLERLLAFKEVFFIAVSEYTKKLMIKKIGVAKDKVKVIYNGVESKNQFANSIAETNDKYGLSANDFIALHPALFYSEKGHLKFLQALTEEKKSVKSNVKILLAGEGPLESEIRGHIKLEGLSDCVKAVGFVSEIEKLYLRADLVILPSEREFLPYAILEAMRYGKPILATNVGAVSEMVLHKISGELFEFEEINKLAKRIFDISDKKNILIEYGLNGKEILKTKFSVEKMIKETEELYDTL